MARARDLAGDANPGRQALQYNRGPAEGAATVTNARYNVFIDGARQGPAGNAALARAIAARYGIPAADLEQRFAAGRFRVKGNVDRATADSYVADLSSLGAVCSVEPSAGAAPTVAAAVTLPGGQRVPAPARPAAPASASAGDDFAALSGESPLTLSTLDGASEDEARSSRKIPVAASFGPPADDSGRGSSRKIPLAASFGPPAAAPAEAAMPASFGPPMDVVDDDAPVEVFDPFAPPEMQAEAQELDLAVERKPRASKAPPAEVAAPAPVVAPAPAPAAPAAARPRGNPLGFLRDDLVRFIAGVVLAVLLAAIPALLIGTARQRSAVNRINAALEQKQNAANTRPEWDGLDRIRASALSEQRDERQSIIVTTLLMWAALAGGLSWLWFRKIDWDRVLR